MSLQRGSHSQNSDFTQRLPCLNALEASTKRLGELLREFKKVTCEAYVTKELPSYDLRREQDSVNPRTHADDDESGLDSHPYWYARVLKLATEKDRIS